MSKNSFPPKIVELRQFSNEISLKSSSLSGDACMNMDPGQEIEGFL